MNEILDYLKIHGECHDTRIAEATGIPLTKARLHLAELAAKGDVMSCLSIRFVDGKKTEGTSYRIAGFVVKSKPGAKSKRVNLKLS